MKVFLKNILKNKPLRESVISLQSLPKSSPSFLALVKTVISRRTLPESPPGFLAPVKTGIQKSQSFPQKLIEKSYSLAFCPKAISFRDGKFTPPPPEKCCKFNSLNHFKHKKTFLLNNKGFSITGVMVASTIGVIAMTGMAKHAALIAQQQRQINKERELNAFWEQFGTETNCEETIKGWLNQNTAPNYPAPTSAQKAKLAEGTEGNEIEFKIIKKSASSNLLDVHDSNNIFSRYGFFPRFFVLRCNPADNGGSCDCKASGTTYPCKKTWTLIPGIQRGMTFIRGKLLTLDITWPAAPNSAYDNFTCDVIGISGGKNRCYKAEATGSKRTLAGCGSTQSLGGTGTTAFGNDVARGATITGANSYFFGRDSGYYATVSGGFNTFLGRSAGNVATVSGGNNTFVGYHAGNRATVAGGNNTFLGDHAGSYADIRSGAIGNVFIGKEAGRKDQGTTTGGYISGDDNSLLGHAAGRTAKISGDYNTFIGPDSGFKGTISKSGNHFVGSSSGRESEVTGGGGYNHFFGNQSGYKTKITAGSSNTFVGTNAGREATISGGGNHFFGDNAGKKATVSGGQNHFIGDHAGQEATVSGSKNTFLGHSAGWNADIRSGADDNVFIGQGSGKKDFSGQSPDGYISGRLNILLGHDAGRRARITGHYNTLIGAGAGHGETISGNGGTYIKGSNVVIKSAGDGVKCAWNEYLRGFDGNGKLCGKRATIGTCPSGQVLRGFNADGTLNCVATGGTGWKQQCSGSGEFLKGFNSAGNKVCASAITNRCPGENSFWDSNANRCVYRQQGRSSKVYKKNIRPFNDMEKALKDVLDTPLFTYYFKDKDNFPKKKRMGVIAEDLPKNLQLKGKPIAPDWPSIYGTLWAGIKALHSTIEANFKALSKTDDQFKKELAGTKKELANTKQELKSANEKIDSLSKELLKLKSSFEKTGLRNTDKQPIR